MSEPTVTSSIVHIRLYVAVERMVIQTQSNMDISLFRCLETGICMQHRDTILNPTISILPLINPCKYTNVRGVSRLSESNGFFMLSCPT